MNITLCLTQGNTAIFKCVVDTMGIPVTDVTWVILDGRTLLSTNGRDRHSNENLQDGNITTGRLRVINVTMNDNGAQYQCSPAVGVNSEPAFLSVLGEIIIFSSTSVYTCMCVTVCKSKTGCKKVQGQSETAVKVATRFDMELRPRILAN